MPGQKAGGVGARVLAAKRAGRQGARVLAEEGVGAAAGVLSVVEGNPTPTTTVGTAWRGWFGAKP